MVKKLWYRVVAEVKHKNLVSNKLIRVKFIPSEDYKRCYTMQCLVKLDSQSIARQNAIRAIDGKRIVIQKPFNSGSHYFDYESNTSIIFLAIFGPNYECLWADVVTNGRAPDGGMWQRTNMKSYLARPTKGIRCAGLLAPKPLPGRERPIPYVLTEDGAFPLRKYLMKLYQLWKLTSEQRVFNCRLSRERRISEMGLSLL